MGNNNDIPDSPNMMDAALTLIGKGFRVFPVKANKKPLTDHGLKDATQTQAGVREYWTKWPAAGIGVPTVILEGQLINKLTSLAGVMRHRGLSEQSLKAALQAINREQCSPPLPENEVDKIAKSISQYPIGPVIKTMSLPEVTPIPTWAMLSGYSHTSAVYLGG